MQPIPSIAKQAKNALLDEFIEQIDKVRNANKNKTPYGFIHKEMTQQCQQRKASL